MWQQKLWDGYRLRELNSVSKSWSRSPYMVSEGCYCQGHLYTSVGKMHCNGARGWTAVFWNNDFSSWSTVYAGFYKVLTIQQFCISCMLLTIKWETRNMRQRESLWLIQGATAIIWKPMKNFDHESTFLGTVKTLKLTNTIRRHCSLSNSLGFPYSAIVRVVVQHIPWNRKMLTNCEVCNLYMNLTRYLLCS
jgi:hypothetical protein